MNNQIVTVNLTPGGSTPAVVRVSQYDVGRPIQFKVLDGTSIASFASNATATVVGTKPTGLGFSVTGAISGNTVTINTTLEMTQECGMIPTEIRFSITNGPNIGTANFILAVEPSPHPDGTTDGTYETMGDLQSQVNALDTRVTALEAGSGGSGLTDDIKTALLQIAQKVAYIDANGQDYYDDLEEALYSSTTRSVLLVLSHVSSSNSASTVEVGDSYTTTLTASENYTLNTVSVSMGGVDVTSTTYSSGTVSIPSVTGNIVITATAVLAAQSITATYTQSGTVYDTATLDSLKADLVVTANYAGGTSETVPASAYTLSGTLATGTSTITVEYAGLTDTFDVTVTHADNSLYSWDFKTGLTDSKQGIVATTTATQTSGTGLVYDAQNQWTLVTGISSILGKTVEIDVVEIGTRVGGNHRRLFLFYGTNSTQQAGLICNAGSTWKYYSGNAWDTGSIAGADASYFDGKTVKIYVSDTGAITVSRKTIGAADSTYEQVYASSIGAISSITADATHCSIGLNTSSDGLGNATISGMRIYGGAS